MAHSFLVRQVLILGSQVSTGRRVRPLGHVELGAQHPGGDGPEGGAGWGSAPWGRDQEVCSWLARADGQCESTPLRLLPAGGPAPLSAALVPPVSPSPAPHLQTGAPEVEGPVSRQAWLGLA